MTVQRRAMPRVVVTGVGMISPLGSDAPSSLARLWAGDRGIGPLTLFELKNPRSKLAAEAVGLDMGTVAARTDAMAIQAAREALRDAGLDPAATPIHLVVGGTTAGMFETEELLTQLGNIDLTEALEVRLKTHPLSSTVDRVCEVAGPFASARTVCCACTSGVAAIALGAAWIRTGRARRVLAGGADALCRLTFSGFGCLMVLSPDTCKPFDASRSGLNLGEGAGFVMLESEDAAHERGAKLIAEVAGFGLGGEAHHITNPEPTGKAAARIMRQALSSAGLEPRDVVYINAHGTATMHNDAAESTAIRACFGEVRPKVSSSKGQIGHTLGAAGAIEAVISAKVVETGKIPPTKGLENPDPACDIDHVFETTQVSVPPVVMSNSFGFGGTGGVLVLARPEHAPVPELPVENDVVISGAAVIARGRLIERAEDMAKLLAPVSADGTVRRDADAPNAEGDPTGWLDQGKSRRMDRSGKLSAAVIGGALRDADRDASAPLDRTNVAAISGTAFGNVDGSMRFMKRVLDKGANMAVPADFPNLVPSSPVSHAAIYWGLGGPAFATPDLSATAEAATATGLELVASGVSSAAAVGSVEEISQLAEKVLAPLLGVRTVAAHSEGASCLIIERAADAFARGRTPLARVRFWSAARGKVAAKDLPAPPPNAKVVAEPAVDVASLLGDSAWASAPRLSLGGLAGEHVGLGGVALAAAAALVRGGDAGSVLVLGEAPARSYAFLLESPAKVAG
ncbi:MAG: beta-ketoacyl-[acyl-carrier-protein] synthase family protein [Polyangiaceae bacterium]